MSYFFDIPSHQLTKEQESLGKIMALAEERALASDKDLSDFAVQMDVPWRPGWSLR